MLCFTDRSTDTKGMTFFTLQSPIVVINENQAFVATGNMSCVRITPLSSYVTKKFSVSFSSDGMSERIFKVS